MNTKDSVNVADKQPRSVDTVAGALSAWRTLESAPRGVPVLVQYHLYDNPTMPLAMQVAWFFDGEWRVFPNCSDTAHANCWMPLNEFVPPPSAPAPAPNTTEAEGATLPYVAGQVYKFIATANNTDPDWYGDADPNNE